MRTARALSVVVGVMALSVGAASGSSGPAPCGPPSPLRTVPTGTVGPGVRAGPIWFVAGRTIRLVPRYPEAVYPTKVLIQAPKPPLQADLTLRGFECASGIPLRFWYPTRGEPRYPLAELGPASSEELRQAGSVVAVLHRARHAQPTKRNGPLTDYRGYILFSQPGMWKVVVRRGTRVLGTAIFRVTAS